MPWAGLKEKVEVGPVTFWPLSSLTAKQVPDEALLSHLHRYFRCYVDHRGKPVDTITLCSHGSLDFRQLTPVEREHVRAAVDALTISVIGPATQTGVCMENNSMAPPSADRYQLVGQNLTPVNGSITVQAGNTLSGGYKISEISFPKPWSMGGPCPKTDSKWLAAFDRLFAIQDHVEAKNRLFRSLQWFRMAHIESDDVSELSRIVMMATAFEILLAIPQGSNKKEKMADEIEKRCGRSDSLQETRQDKKGEDHTRAKIGWWAWDFYELRNRIVHGNEIQANELLYPAPNMDWITHRIVAALVFWECIVRELYDLGCLDKNVREREDRMVQLGLSAEEPKTFILDLLGFGDVHRALGWRPTARRSP